MLNPVFQVDGTLKPDDIIDVAKRALLHLEHGLFESRLSGLATVSVLEGGVRVHHGIILVLFEVWNKALDCNVGALRLVQRL